METISKQELTERIRVGIENLLNMLPDDVEWHSDSTVRVDKLPYTAGTTLFKFTADIVVSDPDA